MGLLVLKDAVGTNTDILSGKCLSKRIQKAIALTTATDTPPSRPS